MESIDGKIDREVVALDLIDRIRWVLRSQLNGSVVSKFVENKPLYYVARLVGNLKGKMQGNIGQIKVEVRVPRLSDEKDVYVKIDFTKNMHLFWWTKTVLLKGAVDNHLDVSLGSVNSVLFDVDMARRGLIRTEWLNRRYDKLKKKKGEGVKLPVRV